MTPADLRRHIPAIGLVTAIFALVVSAIIAFYWDDYVLAWAVFFPAFCVSTGVSFCMGRAWTMGMFHSLRSLLKQKEAQVAVVEEKFEISRQWNQQFFRYVLIALRDQLEADSPLLRTINDLTMLLNAASQETPAKPQLFNLDILLDSALADAKIERSPGQQLHLITSLEHGAMREWNGYPEELQSILKHLLLISLRRTNSGYICLRLEIKAPERNTLHHRLHLHLEDSGMPIQRVQLERWFDRILDINPMLENRDDMSWLIVSRLLNRLQGNACIEEPEEHGFQLTLSLPLLQAEDASHIPVQRHSLTQSRSTILLLVAENDRSRAESLRRNFAPTGCQLFVVESHQQLLDWAPILPFSAILLNTSLIDARDMVIERLHKMMDDKLLPTLPLWALIVNASTVEYTYWQQRGVHELLVKPLRQKHLTTLCQTLVPASDHFYNDMDMAVRQDLPAGLAKRIPELHDALKRELHMLENLLIPPINTGALLEQAHAVKSASLSLGFYRIAALANEIEHAINTHGFLHAQDNWPIISRSIKEAQTYLIHEHARVA